MQKSGGGQARYLHERLEQFRWEKHFGNFLGTRELARTKPSNIRAPRARVPTCVAFQASGSLALMPGTVTGHLKT